MFKSITSFFFSRSSRPSELEKALIPSVASPESIPPAVPPPKDEYAEYAQFFLTHELMCRKFTITDEVRIKHLYVRPNHRLAMVVGGGDAIPSDLSLEDAKPLIQERVKKFVEEVVDLGGILVVVPTSKTTIWDDQRRYLKLSAHCLTDPTLSQIEKAVRKTTIIMEDVIAKINARLDAIEAHLGMAEQAAAPLDYAQYAKAALIQKLQEHGFPAKDIPVVSTVHHISFVNAAGESAVDESYSIDPGVSRYLGFTGGVISGERSPEEIQHMIDGMAERTAANVRGIVTSEVKLMTAAANVEVIHGSRHFSFSVYHA
jgi:hypothetical protein